MPQYNAAFNVLGVTASVTQPGGQPPTPPPALIGPRIQFGINQARAADHFRLWRSTVPQFGGAIDTGITIANDQFSFDLTMIDNTSSPGVDYWYWPIGYNADESEWGNVDHSAYATWIGDTTIMSGVAWATVGTAHYSQDFGFGNITGAIINGSVGFLQNWQSVTVNSVSSPPVGNLGVGGSEISYKRADSTLVNFNGTVSIPQNTALPASSSDGWIGSALPISFLIGNACVAWNINIDPNGSNIGGSSPAQGVFTSLLIWFNVDDFSHNPNVGLFQPGGGFANAGGAGPLNTGAPLPTPLPCIPCCSTVAPICECRMPGQH